VNVASVECLADGRPPNEISRAFDDQFVPVGRQCELEVFASTEMSRIRGTFDIDGRNRKLQRRSGRITQEIITTKSDHVPFALCR